MYNMGKDSAFYKEKNKNQLLRLREILDRLPGFCVEFIQSKELTTQTSTLISYGYDLLTFLEFLREKNPLISKKEIKSISIEDISLLSEADITEYQRYLQLNVGDNPHENGKRSIARKMSPLRSLYKYHLLHKNIKENPTELVALPKLKKDKNIIRMDNYEVRAIITAIKNGDEQMSEKQRSACKKTLKRDLALMTLMVGTGIRVSECNGLDLTDVDLRSNTLTIVRKGGGQDVLYFSDDIHDVLEDYIENERVFIIPKSENETALFLSRLGQRMSVDAIEKLVKKYAKIAVPNKKITPHKLRSTYGTALYRETGDIRLVADVLGHENINTTIDYYAAIEDEHKRSARNAVDFNRKD